MIFDDYFDDVYIISLPDKKGRLARTLRELRDKSLCENPKVVRAISGDTVGISAWFGSGGGAWGCLMSHTRILQDFLMDYNYRGVTGPDPSFKDRKILILEDDVIFSHDAAEQFKKFTDALPDDWGQFYLGGQHIYAPKCFTKDVLIGSSINRTHAYAVSGRAAKSIQKHITYYPDYSGTSKHVDHQLEAAHRRGDWKVYCPTWWIAGQGENVSSISGRRLPDKWWDYRTREDLDHLPIFVMSETEKYDEHLQYLCYGEEGVSFTSLEITIDEDTKDLINEIPPIAWDQRKFPLIKCKGLNEEKLNIMKRMRKGPVLLLSENIDKLEEMCNNYSTWKK